MLTDHIENTGNHVVVHLSHNRPVLSSAPYHGGLVNADRLLIQKVTENFKGTKGPFEPPMVTLKKYCRQQGWPGMTVGMMTSAKMSSFRHVHRQSQGVVVAAVVTAGVSNARRAGDPADYRQFETEQTLSGTINSIILTNATLTPAAHVEAVMVATEAKTAILQELDIISPVSAKSATGTGTDAIAVVNGLDSPKITFCGKHTLFGEMLALVTMEALFASLSKQACR